MWNIRTNGLNFFVLLFETARLTQDFDINSDSLASNGGVIQLAESGIGDEEVHALAALLRGNGNITELNLRANVVTDEGARALGAVLAGSAPIKKGPQSITSTKRITG